MTLLIKYSIYSILLGTYAIFGNSYLLAEDMTSALEHQKIELLLEAVENSGATFIRNGEEHTSQKAREHLEYKYQRARKKFLFFGPPIKVTARQFIDKIASESSTSGNPYFIRPQGAAKAVPTREWLNKKLEAIEKKLNGTAQTE